MKKITETVHTKYNTPNCDYIIINARLSIYQPHHLEMAEFTKFILITVAFFFIYCNK